ncbi:MAG: DNA polymerase III subunit delta [Ignavibacteria bacterium RBG_16_34_14]|nr:MAG: DNA polymerase III subunit delta [Ignavibacteria bacterium RBG_16_34_14]
MANNKRLIPSILEAVKEIKKGKLKPLYYFSGEDSFGIDAAYKLLEQKVTPLLTSDFDREIIYSEGKTLPDILNSASAFPFGSSKKLVVVKESEKIKDKKSLLTYAASPPEFTVLIFLHYGKISNPESEVYKNLIDAGFLFEAKELKGKNLVDWLIDYAESKRKVLKEDNAQLLIDIAGENRNLLETQVEKIITFLREEKEINHKVINEVTSALKEFSIFDLQNAVAKKDKQNSLSIALKLMDSGIEPTFIIYMLTKFFTGLSRVNEIKEQKLNVYAASRIVGTHFAFYDSYLKARSLYSDEKIFIAAQALFKADLLTKTTSSNPKNVIAILIAEILE